jgi:hypothetical protein
VTSSLSVVTQDARMIPVTFETYSSVSSFKGLMSTTQFEGIGCHSQGNVCIRQSDRASSIIHGEA